jgi:hypothetical protein
MVAPFERSGLTGLALRHQGLDHTAGQVHPPLTSVTLAKRPWGMLIPLPDHSELMMYGNEVMDLTILGLRSM